MKTRIISAVVGLIIFAAIMTVYFLGFPYIFYAVIALVSAMAVYEMLHSTKMSQSVILDGASVIYAVTFCVTAVYSHNKCPDNLIRNMGIAAGAFTVIYVIFAAIFSRKSSFKALSLGFIFALYLPAAFTSLSLLLDIKKGGVLLFLMPFVYSWISDAGAYFIGRKFGKHKLAPITSPKKTVEGAVGGVICSAVFSVIVVLIYNACSGNNGSVLWFTILSVPLSILGIFGDLTASKVKRHYGIKDYAHLIPGHGGIMDRFDSLIYILPVLFVIAEFTDILIK